MLFWAFFFWEERGINWQWWLHSRYNRWPLCHYCFCNCSGAVIACQLSLWHLFVLLMYADLSSYILTGLSPAFVSVLDVVNLIYLLNDLNMILVSGFWTLLPFSAFASSNNDTFLLMSPCGSGLFSRGLLHRLRNFSLFGAFSCFSPFPFSFQ